MPQKTCMLPQNPCKGTIFNSIDQENCKNACFLVIFYGKIWSIQKKAVILSAEM